MPDAYPFTTAILRFRDLVTAPHDTVRLHKDIIDAAKGVWWGWWSKAGERIPDSAFRQLRDLAHVGDGLDVFLMDSGTGRVYRAACRDLSWGISHQRLASPNTAETPAYYSKQQYLAWFRFSAIELTDEARLREYSYVRVDDFFQEGASRYTPFYDKRVHSVGELRQQDRTIWFVRPAQGSDPVHEVALLDPRRITPVHFTKQFFESPNSTVLWISDPHLSADAHHGFPLDSDSLGNKSLGHAIEDACKDVAHLEQVAAIWLSGDLTWRATPSEFELARKFIGRLNTWAKLDNYNYAVCPGNHDLRFSDDPADKTKPVAVAGAAAAASYAQFYTELFYQGPNDFLCCGRRYLLGASIPIEVVMLNSSLLQQTADHFQGHGFVGDDQLRYVAEQYGWDEAPSTRPLRILVVHHHLLPVTYRERPVGGRLYSVMLDAEAVMRWAVRARVDLVLHGHMHQPFHSSVTRRISLDDKGPEHTIAIVGAGSAGVESNHLGEVKRNTFAALTFHRDQVELKMYSISSSTPSSELWSIVVPLPRCQS
jgi:3',5'-cyclic AMP phosphodiesterase CpdA